MTAGDQRHYRANEVLTRLKVAHDVLKRARPLDEEAVEHALIQAHPEEQSWLIRLALHIHLNNETYLQSLSHGGPRFGLDGEPVGKVDVDARHRAHALLKHRRAHRRRRHAS